ncbi:hypothetical protein [Pseudomonas sp. RIT-To-2]|uniref:hypothetical protein n=1 Tax=Pseudomonas sp. RIT-To-2 TaxID=3462541 RepID=UPI002413B7A9
MLTNKIAMSYVNYEKSPTNQVLIEFFGLAEGGEEVDDEDPQVSVTVSYNPHTHLYDRCNTVDDLDSDGDQDDADREICIELAAAFIAAMGKLNPDIDRR